MYDELLIDEKDFSWSLSRENLFNFCRRAYFYHYYGSTGGYEKFSDVELLYQLKKLQSVELWINTICTEILRELFYENNESFDPYKAAESRFRSGARSLALREWRNDPQQLNLFVLYYGLIEIDELIESSTVRLKQYIDHLHESGLINYLREVPYLSRKTFAFPASTNIGRIKSWISPAVVWLEDGLLKFLTLNNGKNNQFKFRYTAALHEIYAFNKLRIQPERVVTLNFDLSTGETTVINDDDINISEVIDHIRKSSAAMLDLMTDHNCVFEGNFSRNKTNCVKCRFKNYCNSQTSG